MRSEWSSWSQNFLRHPQNGQWLENCDREDGKDAFRYLFDRQLHPQMMLLTDITYRNCSLQYRLFGPYRE